MKVLGFDSWTQGSQHFERLVPALKERSIDLILLHVGSWGTEPGRPKEEERNGLIIRDINYYAGASFSQILELEKPSLVLFISTDALAHRAFNRICKIQKIPTLYLYNGLARVQNLGEGYQTGFWAHSKLVFRSLKKAIKHVWPAYLESLIKSKAPVKDWVEFIKGTLSGVSGKIIPDQSPVDSKMDKCCVFIKADVSHAIDKFGYKEDDVIVVGNPDLIRFKINSSHLGYQLTTQSKSSTVLYIDTGLVSTGWVYSSLKDFTDHILKTKHHLGEMGWDFLFKPHPDQFNNGVVSILREGGVVICENHDFLGKLMNCGCAIVEPSSISILPALIGMPMFLAKYGKLENCPFGEILTSYPRAVSLRSLDLLNVELEKEAGSLNNSDVWEWITENSGPMPADDMPTNVAKVVYEMI